MVDEVRPALCLPFNVCAFGDALCSFPRAAVAKDHKLCGLEQQKSIHSQSWAPDN